MKLSVIGTGDWGCVLIPKFEELCGVYKLYGHQNIDYLNEEDFVFDEDLPGIMAESDAVVIATPPESHYEIALRALQADCHVWVEPPMCLCIEDAHKLVTEAHRRDKVLFVDHQFCYSDSVDWLTPFNDCNEVVTEVEGRFYSTYHVEQKLNSTWNLGCQLVALLVYLKLPLSKFQLKTTCHAKEQERSFEVSYQSGIKYRWDILAEKHDLVMKACEAFLAGIEIPGHKVRTDGDHGFEVIRALEFLSPRRFTCEDIKE